jgi:hypothetical protein
MDTLEIQKQNALDAYNNANDDGKKLLSTLFGKDVFIMKITDRIKTFEDALKVCPPTDNVKILLDYNGVDADMLAAQAFAKLTLIGRALNEGWQPKWEDTDQYKYYPYFKHQGGFGLADGDYGYGYTSAGVGSRLCFKNATLAEYAGKQFADIYNTFLSL